MNDSSFLTYKKILRWIWLSLIILFLGLYLFYAELFTVDNFKTLLGENGNTVLFIYILISSSRALFLLPSTPFVLLGLALYPNSLLFVFIISLFGIQIGASLMYLAASYLTPATLFGHKSKKVDIIKVKMKKYGNWIIMSWALFPIVPTDLICFVSGSIKYSFNKFFFSILIGESILVGVYLIGGTALSK